MRAFAHLPAAATVRISPVSYAGIAALALTKFGDLLTTVVGLTLVDGLTERNPVAAAVIGHFGFVGLAVTSGLVVCAVVLVVEWATTVLRRSSDDRVDPAVLYLVSYLPLSVVFALTTVSNAMLVLRVSGQ